MFFCPGIAEKGQIRYNGFMVRMALLFTFFWIFVLFLTIFLIPIGLFNLLRLRKAAEGIIVMVVSVWAKTVFFLAGIKIEIRGREKIPGHNRVCFVANHQSYGDIPLILGYLDKKVGFIAKGELKKVPLINLWMMALHCVFINRGQGRQSLKKIEEGMKQIPAGHPLVLFPEGTRAKNGVMKPFKSGGIQMAVKEDITVVPVTIDGMFHAYEEQKKVVPTTVVVTVHDSIDTAGMNREERKALTGRVQEIVMSALPQQYWITDTGETPGEDAREAEAGNTENF